MSTLQALGSAAFEEEDAEIRIGSNLVKIPTANPLLQTAIQLRLIPTVKPEEATTETSTETEAWSNVQLATRNLKPAP